MNLNGIIKTVCEVCEIESIQPESKLFENLVAKALYAHYAAECTLNTTAILKTARMEPAVYYKAKRRYNDLIRTDFTFRNMDRAVQLKLEQIKV